MPPDRSYRIVPPTGWRILPGDAGEVQFRSVVADQGYWPGMLISREPAPGFQVIGPKERMGINALVAEDRQAFRFVSGEMLDLPFGEAYLVIYEHTFKDLRMRTAEAHVVQDGIKYWVPFNALAETFDRHFPAYFGCLETFSHSSRHVCN